MNQLEMGTPLVSSFLHFDQLWISELTSIWKKKKKSLFDEG
jgi:hypothetical protein